MEHKLDIESYHQHCNKYGEEISVLSIPLEYQSQIYRCSIENIEILIREFNENKEVSTFSGVSYIIKHLMDIKKLDKINRYDINGNENKLYVAFLSTVIVTYKNMFEAYERLSFNENNLNRKEYRWHKCATDRELGVCECIIEYFDKLLDYVIIDESIENIHKYTETLLKNANDKFVDMYECIREIDNCSEDE